MNNVIGAMMAKYHPADLKEREYAVKEVIQEIVLCGLSRAGFFKQAAFYGGTALRVFYGLERFSEDLDFSLAETNLDFDLSKYFPTLRKELAAYGLNMEVSEKKKTKVSAIRSAFLKGGTKEHMLMFYSPDQELMRITSGEMIKIKFEVDVDPPAGANFERKFRLLPSAYDIVLYDMPSLFAGKLHAVVCRAWQNRVKGRDLYDYLFYLSRGASVNMEHLKARLVQSGYWKEKAALKIGDVKKMLRAKFDDVDYEKAKLDVAPFVRDKRELDLWNADFFKQITENLK